MFHRARHPRTVAASPSSVVKCVGGVRSGVWGVVLVVCVRVSVSGVLFSVGLCVCVCDLLIFLHLPFTPPIHTSHSLSCRVLRCCGVVLVVSCVVLFLLCVCVHDLFLFLHLPFTPPIHTCSTGLAPLRLIRLLEKSNNSHLPFTPPIHTSHSHLFHRARISTTHLDSRRIKPFGRTLETSATKRASEWPIYIYIFLQFF